MRFSYTGNFFLSIKRQTYPLGILIKTLITILQMVTLSEVIDLELQILADKTLHCDIILYAKSWLKKLWYYTTRNLGWQNFSIILYAKSWLTKLWYYTTRNRLLSTNFGWQNFALWYYTIREIDLWAFGGSSDLESDFFVICIILFECDENCFTI